MSQATPSFKFCWEDFHVGDVKLMGSHTVTEAEILDFARQFDPQRFHVDVGQAQKTIYKGLIASGWHTCGLIFRMACDGFLLESSSMGSPGLENVRWLKPVRPGDTLRTRIEILETRPMASKPDLGMVKVRWEGLNQRDEVVVSMENWGMFGRREPESKNPQ
jgi:acyl dehydratase